jgi:hypothetical protein
MRWLVVVAVGCCTACGDATGPGGWLHDGALLTFELAQVTTYDCDTTLIEPRDDALCGNRVVEVLVSADTIRVRFTAASDTSRPGLGSGSRYFDVGSTYGTSSYSRLLGSERYRGLASGKARLCAGSPAVQCDDADVRDSIAVSRGPTCEADSCPEGARPFVMVMFYTTPPVPEGRTERTVGALVMGRDEGGDASGSGPPPYPVYPGRRRTENTWTLRRG